MCKEYNKSITFLKAKKYFNRGEEQKLLPAFKHGLL